MTVHCAFPGRLQKHCSPANHRTRASTAKDLFAVLYARPEALRGVLGSMSGISAGAARAIAARFRWSHHKTFADIGAAQGMVPATLAIAHPHLRGIGFDLPQVQPVFEEFVAGLGPSDRVQYQEGNFFE